jgi:hypothetical protein
MGCDIHLYAERLITPKWWEFWKKSKWVSIDKYTSNPDFGEYDFEPEFIIESENRIYSGRNYNLFCALAGVRGYQFEGEPSMVSEPKGLPNDVCDEIKRESAKYGSDGHSHSWNTLAELEAFNWEQYGTTCDRFKEKVFPKLRTHSKDPDKVRIVYFFDN